MNGAELFDRIALTRADGRCECEGSCGGSHRFAGHTRCGNVHGRPAIHGADKVVSLAVVPRDRNGRNLADGNLIAYCQACLKRHRAKAKAAADKTAAAEAAVGGLFDIPDSTVATGTGATL